MDNRTFLTSDDPNDLEEYDFESVPIGQQVSLMDEQFLGEYLPALRNYDGSLHDIGYHTTAIVRGREHGALDLSTYPGLSRFHEISVHLPRHQFIVCLARGSYNIKPVIFVKGDWLTDFHLRHHCVFALFDAVGVREILASGVLSSERLLRLRSAVDEFADKQSSIALVSFADSILVKTSYQLGQYDHEIPYSYNPEAVIRIFPEIREIFRATLGLGVYACVAQGPNYYNEATLLHVSKQGHHVALNSLGLPFAELIAIDRAARAAIRDGVHPPRDLYMDKTFYNSLRLNWEFRRAERRKYIYQNPITRAPSHYFAEQFDTIAGALASEHQ